MAMWFPRVAGSSSHGRGFANNSLVQPCPGSTLGTSKERSVSKTGNFRLPTYIRGRDLDAPDVTFDNLLVITPRF